MKVRYFWIDYIKVLAIFAVVLGHMNTPFTSFIYSWHMPIFYMISGAFLKKEESHKVIILHSFKRLMIPYFVFSVIALIIEVFKRKLLDRVPLDVIEQLYGVIFWMDFEHLKASYAFLLWFLPSLFFARLILNYVVKKSFSLQVLLITFLTYISLRVNLPFSLDNAFLAISFLWFGYVIFQYLHRPNNSFNFLYGLVAFIILLIVYFWIGFPKVDISSKEIENIFIAILWSCSIFILLMVLFDKLCTNPPMKIVSIISYNTMIIYLLHPYTNNIGFIISSYYGSAWVFQILISSLLLAVLIFLKNIIERKGIKLYV